jgi:diadenosine tetraphosphate (Ap4A) HIT family hydrolase
MEEKACLFCDRRNFERLILAENSTVFVILNRFPNNIEGHTLIIPKRHYDDFTKIDVMEFSHFCILAQRVAAVFLKEESFPSVRFVIMQGKEAGASISHCHIHIIPLKRDEPPPLPRKAGEKRREVTPQEIKKFKRLFD